MAKLAQDLANNLDVNETQTEAEKTKNKPNQAKLHQFERDRKQLNEQLQICNEYMEKIAAEYVNGWRDG